MKLIETIKKITAICFSLLIFFVAGELAIRLYLKHKTVYDIEMAAYATKLKIDAENPLIGHMHKPNTSLKLMNVMVNINDDGFRDRNYPESKTGAYRIVFLGDSLTFGWGVEHENTFEYILEKKINQQYPAEIINMGAGNYNTEQEVNAFIEKGLKYHPDKVVVFYFINDAEPTPQKSKLWFLAHSRLLTFYWSKIHAMMNNVSGENYFLDYYKKLYQENQQGWICTKKALLQLKNLADGNNFQLQVVLLPELHNLTNYPFKNEYDLVTKFLYHNNIDHLNLTPFFEGNQNPMSLWVAPDDAHPNAAAHRLIAEYSLNFISNGGKKT